MILSSVDRPLGAGTPQTPL